MRDKKWVDCPACGSKGSMEFRTDVTEVRAPKGYPSVKIKGLKGYFCKVCGDGVWLRESENKIAAEVMALKAREDAKVIPAGELVSVANAAKVIGVTPSRIHQMMDRGDVRYVFVDGLRFPVRRDLERLKESRRKQSIASSG
jgi:YgiT-type zinc finger domain-containing protein